MNNKKEKLLKLASDPNFISGIYNYCDRWCEKCAFTGKCLNFAMSEHEETDKDLDMDNERFWNKIYESFQLAHELIEDMAEEMGIDLNEIETDNIAREEERIQHSVMNHSLVKSGMLYIKMVEQNLQECKEILEEKGEEWCKMIEMNINPDDIEEKALKFNDLFEVIKWYQFFISAKISRALSGLHYDFEAELDDYPKDSDGSAKIAIIAIERSIAAWSELLNHFPEMEDSILDILIHLKRLMNETERIFPEARFFIRPGFD